MEESLTIDGSLNPTSSLSLLKKGSEAAISFSPLPHCLPSRPPCSFLQFRFPPCSALSISPSLCLCPSLTPPNIFIGGVAATVIANTVSIRLRQSHFMFVLSRTACHKCLGELELNKKCLTCDAMEKSTATRLMCVFHPSHSVTPSTPNRAIS